MKITLSWALAALFFATLRIHEGKNGGLVRTFHNN